MNRVELLKNQLSSKTEAPIDNEDPKKLLHKYRSKSTINADVFRSLTFGRHQAFRKHVHDVMAKNPILKPHTVTESSRKEMREISLRWIHYVMKNAFPLNYEDYKKDPAQVTNMVNYLFEFDGALAIKLGVHFGLYFKTIMNLGTEKHVPYIDRAFALEDIGSFSLTELGHGSNVKGVQTTATFDPKTREFIINTPNDTAMKFWIGAAAHLANTTVCMAQLIVNGKNHGVHGFIVPIRDKKDHTLMPGVVIGDCGLKVGLNAIDNGFLIFKNVRIPYDNFLDRFSHITPEGKFKSPIKSDNKRFGMSLGSLSGGRLQLINWTNSMLRNSLTVAIRFAACRRQFGPPQSPETNILEYPLTQYRLLPYLAESIAIEFTNNPIRDTWNSSQVELFQKDVIQEDNPLLTEIHNVSSAVKPIASWLSQRGIQECREVCGGLGYSAYNRIGHYREDNDINATWEGDNNVLIQQTSKFLMDNLRSLKGGETLPYPSLHFLQPEFNSYTVEDGKSGFNRDNFDLQKAFEVRANYLTHAAYEHFSKNVMNSEDMWSAWNDSQVFYLRDCAIAFGENYILHNFGKIIETCKDEKTKLVLNKLYNLYGYNKLEQHAVSYLEAGYFTKEDLTMIRQRVKELCFELKDEAVGIIDAISLPDQLLCSPIGAYDGDIYNRFINAVMTAPGAFERAPYWKEIHGGK